MLHSCLYLCMHVCMYACVYVFPKNIHVKENKGLSLFKNTDGELVHIFDLVTYAFPTQVSNAIVLLKVIFYKS